MKKVVVLILAIWLSIVILISLIYKDELLRLLQSFSDVLRNSKFLGFLVCGGFVFISSSPVIFTFGLSVTFTGYVFGWPMGAFIALPFAFLGACTCFGVVRLRHNRVPQNRSSDPDISEQSDHDSISMNNLSSSNESRRKSSYVDMVISQRTRKIIQVAFDRDGLRLLILLRLAPLPFSIVNATLATIPNVSFRQFYLSTGIGILKYSLTVYLGASLKSLTGGDQSNETKSLLITYTFIIILILGLSSIYMKKVWDKIVRDIEDGETEAGELNNLR